MRQLLYDLPLSTLTCSQAFGSTINNAVTVPLLLVLRSTVSRDAAREAAPVLLPKW